MMDPMTTEDLEASVRRRLFTVDEVNRMAELGILGEDEPLELLDGELVIVSPQNPRHAACLAALTERLVEAYRGVAHVRPQVPLDARPHSLPEPDLAVVKGRPSDYSERHPGGREALLVIEIARTSHQLDQRKVRIYAGAGVPIYWLVDLAARRLEVFWAPSARGVFEERQVLGPDDDVELPGLDVRWAVADIVR
jgi:Uma2 family endonuclease